ncbi:HTH-type transcriptional regulator TdcA [Salmonella enterica subsp. enterica serovar Choleraesuis]|nr:HTH-type transcriptional regulator TdcA [Salmonella enterica subsp. enterica serovar Choleraesuis]
MDGRDMDYLPKTQHLVIFQEVVRCGGIRAAARSLGLTQPSVTKTISDLEKNLGVELLIRNNLGIELTEAGRMFLSHARSIIQGLNRSVSEVKRTFDSRAVEIAFGFSSLISFTCLAQIVNQFKTHYPSASLVMQEAQLSSLLPALREGRLDFAIGTISPEMPLQDFNIVPLFVANFVYVAALKHPLANCQTLEALKNTRWVLPVTDMGYYNNLFCQLRRSGFNLDNVIRTDSVVTIYNLVASCRFITVLSEAMARPFGINTFTTIPINQPLPSANYALVWYKNARHSEPVEELIQLFTETRL